MFKKKVQQQQRAKDVWLTVAQQCYGGHDDSSNGPSTMVRNHYHL